MIIMAEKTEKENKEEKKEEKKVEEKKEEKKKPKVAPKPIEIPEQAKARGEYLPISVKQAVNVCRFITRKKVSYIIPYLEDVIKKKKAIPYVRHKRHTPHRKGPMTAGRYPVKATEYILGLVKSAQANATYLGLSEEDLIVKSAIPNRAFSKASKRGRFSHVEVTVAEKKEKKKEKKKEVKK